MAVRTLMIPPGYRIRPALPADIPSLAGVERAADERFVALAGQLGLPGAALAQVTARAVLERAGDEGRLWVWFAACRPREGDVIIAPRRAS